MNPLNFSLRESNSNVIIAISGKCHIFHVTEPERAGYFRVPAANMTRSES